MIILGNIFTALIHKCSQLARVIVLGKPLLMFVGRTDSLAHLYKELAVKKSFITFAAGANFIQLYMAVIDKCSQ